MNSILVNLKNFIIFIESMSVLTGMVLLLGVMLMMLLLLVMLLKLLKMCNCYCKFIKIARTNKYTYLLLLLLVMMLLLLMLLMVPLNLLFHCFAERYIIFKLKKSFSSYFIIFMANLFTHTLNQVLASLLCDHRDLLICSIGTILGMNTLMMIQQCQM